MKAYFLKIILFNSKESNCKNLKMNLKVKFYETFKFRVNNRHSPYLSENE